MSTPERLVLLGASGSIGRSTLDVVDELGERFSVVGLSCHNNWRDLARVAAKWRPVAVAIADPDACAEAVAEAAFEPGVEMLAGPDGLAALASWSDADVVLNGVVGAAGLPATLAALEAGKRVALANKESLVVGGELVMQAAGPGQLLPVDSEHNAIWQLLEGRSPDTVRRIVLTASGGPFREASVDELRGVTPDDALAHPTWDMGPKITVDSATLANKGLEVIEAHHLFGLEYARIDVVIHPQSIVHGLVECVDGSLFAELGAPDMRMPIRAALTYPRRVDGAALEDLTQLSGLTFEVPDIERFPALSIARSAGEAGGTAPAVFNAANEVAVGAFLAGQIGFLEIASVCARVLDEHKVGAAESVAALMTADAWARDRATVIAGIERTPTAMRG